MLSIIRHACRHACRRAGDAPRLSSMSRMVLGAASVCLILIAAGCATGRTGVGGIEWGTDRTAALEKLRATQADIISESDEKISVGTENRNIVTNYYFEKNRLIRAEMDISKSGFTHELVFERLKNRYGGSYAIKRGGMADALRNKYMAEWRNNRVVVRYWWRAWWINHNIRDSGKPETIEIASVTEVFGGPTDRSLMEREQEWSKPGTIGRDPLDILGF